MSRPKRIHKCRSCGVDFTWERLDNSIRQVNLNGSVHYCGKPAGIPDSAIQPEPVKTIPVDVLGQLPTAKSEPLPEVTAVGKPEAGKPIYDLVRPYVIDDINANNVKIVAGIASQISTTLGNHIESVDKLVSEAIKQAQVIEHVITIKRDNVTDVKLTGCHRQQPKLMRYLSLGKNVLLVGPAGTGKTTAGHKAAEALGLKYYPISLGPQTSKSDFFGFTDAHGKAVWTVVREAFTNGGLLLMDEMDATGAGALTYVNAILANGHAAFPSDNGAIEVVQKHKDFLVIACANTYGLGANRMYVGRQQLDAATLDRFIGIDWDYDTDLERKIGAAQMAYVSYIWSIRDKGARLAIRAVFGTRKIINGVDLLNDGVSLDDVKSDVVFFGVSEDDKRKLGV